MEKLKIYEAECYGLKLSLLKFIGKSPTPVLQNVLSGDRAFKELR